MSNLRVLHVIPGIDTRFGGPSAAIGPMCAALNRLSGLEVELATTDAGPGDARLDPAQIPTGFVTHLFRRGSLRRWNYSAALSKWLVAHVKDFDLVHIHALWSFSSFAARRAAQRARVPYLIRPAGMLSQYTWSRRRLSRGIYWMMCERGTIGAAGFHATSEGEARDIRRVRRNAQVFVIPHGVDDQAWTVPRDPEALRRRCGRHVRDRPILLFLSRLHSKKGITDFLLPAWSRLRTDGFLAIAGGTDDGEPEYAQRVRTEVERLDLSERVALLGPIGPQEKWLLFDGACACVLPSHSENFGLVVAEAMARGCPVVVSEAVEAAEHVAWAGAGMTIPLNVAAWADGLEKTLASPSQRATWSEAGGRYAAAHFRWDRIAGNIADMYRQVCRA